MFEDNGATLPALTLAIIAVSNFIKEKWYVLLIVIFLVVFIFYQLYKRVQKFRESVQILLMHTPICNNIIIYNEIANFTKTFASLLNHGVFITDSMEILSQITNNEVYKRIINKTLENLGKGDSISSAFKGEWAIPVVAYEMIVTGETTGQLGNMMEKVASHFQMLHKNVIDQMKSLVEPLLICFLAVVVGIILVSIIQPMFSIYSQIS
jgi:type IV pilus assembly protein PilC